jgi:hypothetical protein
LIIACIDLAKEASDLKGFVWIDRKNKIHFHTFSISALENYKLPLYLSLWLDL